MLDRGRTARRRVPGGVGNYARGLLAGLQRCAAEGDGVDVTLLASRPPRRGSRPAGRLRTAGRRVRAPGPPDDPGLGPLRAPRPGGLRVVHSVSLAAPMLRRASPSRLVVTVHDLAWRRHPEATTRRGRRWHEARAPPRPRRRCRTSSCRRASSPRTSPRSASTRRGSPWCAVAPTTWRHPTRTATGALLQRMGVPGGYLLTVGTLEPRKNLDRLVRGIPPGPAAAARAVGRW